MLDLNVFFNHAILRIYLHLGAVLVRISSIDSPSASAPERRSYSRPLSTCGVYIQTRYREEDGVRTGTNIATVQRDQRFPSAIVGGHFGRQGEIYRTDPFYEARRLLHRPIAAPTSVQIGHL